MILGLARGLRNWFRFTIDAVFARNIPFGTRLRMLATQPVILLTYTIASYPWIFSRPFTVEWLPIAPRRSLRALVFKSPGSRHEGTTRKLRPLHIDIHGGAFIGGLPESDAFFCQRVAEETGAVVISITYRYAPANTFPAAHDDVDAVLAYLVEHAEERYGADPSLVTLSGFSAGGNLALSGAQSIVGRAKASVTYYAPISLRLKPEDKPRPASFPKRDPLAFMLPLYDAYAGPARKSNMDNPRMSPAIAKIEALPENMLLVVPGIDICVHEQLTFVERVKEDAAKDPKQAERRFEALYIEKAFHGYLELPSTVVPQAQKDFAFGAGVQFIRDVHQKYGWTWR